MTDKNAARDHFGPSAAKVEAKMAQLMKDLANVRTIGQDLKQAGVTQDAKQANLSLVKSDHSNNAAYKDMGVQQGDRPALSPCDGRVQANSQADIKQAGQALQNAGVKQSAAQQFARPTQTPSVPPPSQGRSR